jgi:hypothetical protein
MSVSRLKMTLRKLGKLLLFSIAVGIAAFEAIGSSHAIAQRAGESTSLETDGWGRIDISAAVPVPGPPQCPPCWKPVEFGENFDAVTPPMLPAGWIATNVQGPPPLTADAAGTCLNHLHQ